MNRWFPILLAVFLLAGCSSEKTVSVEETQVIKEANETAASEESETFHHPLTITVQEKHLDGYDEETGNVKLLDFSYPEIQVCLPENQDTANLIMDIINQENDCFISGNFQEGDLYASLGAEESLGFAKERYEEFGEDFYPFSVERTCSVIRGDDRILSLSLADYIYLGGAHGSRIEKAMNFDLQTGQLLHLEDLSVHPEDFKEFLLQRMVEQAKSDPAVGDGINWFKPEEYREAFSDLLRDGSWNLGYGNLEIRSLEYELGAYAAGPITFTVPIQDLRFYIKEAYLPEHEDDGILKCTDSTEAFLVGEFTRDEKEKPIYLEAEGTIRDLSLRELKWFPDGSSFVEGKLLFYCGEMKDSALSLNIEIPELMPDLFVSYKSADGQYHKGAICQSGKDGHYFLMDLSDLS